jgi:hypothetical protein
METKIDDVPDAENDREIDDPLQNEHQTQICSIKLKYLPKKRRHHKKKACF